MDILVHPSRREGLARALPQGRWRGGRSSPTTSTATAKALIEGETGFVLPPFDKHAAGGEDRSVGERSGAAARMGERGREFALSRFDAKVMVGRAGSRFIQQR